MEQDLFYMQKALELARKGVGLANPNPMVGAVIVKNGKIIGEGYHAFFGGSHAEINAFHSATESVKGSTLYVTLEPCSYFGKTPPCTDAIIERKIKRVVIGMLDPNPLVNGKGMEILKDAGMDVSSGLLEGELSELNRVFLKFIKTKQPYVIMKTAMTFDGKIATHRGDSKWISNVRSRDNVHRLRHEFAAIMIGVNTVIADNPFLTTRLKNEQGKNPLRVVVDSKARISLNARVLCTTDDASTLLVVTEKAPAEKLEKIRAMGNDVLVVPSKNGKVNLNILMQNLGERGIDGILLEGGATLNFAALEAGIVDEVISFIAPKIVGGTAAITPVGGEGIAKMDRAIGVKDIKISRLDDNFMLTGKIKKEQ